MLRWVGSFVLVAAVALLGLTAWVLGTESGANWLAREAELLTDGAVRMTGVHGSLAEGIEVDGLEIAAGATRIGGQGLALRFLPAGLLSRRLSVSTLSARRIELVIRRSRAHRRALPRSAAFRAVPGGGRGPSRRRP